jgi:hypothetical protein
MIFLVDNALITQQSQCKQSQPPCKKPSPKKAFVRDKETSQPNIVAGMMLEVNDDRETKQLVVAYKTIQVKFLDKMMVVPVDQELACPCCYKKTTICGLLHTHTHTNACSMY